MALQDVLASIPGRGAYLAQQQFDQQQTSSGLGQLLGLMNARRQQEHLAQEQELQPLRMEMMKAQMGDLQRKSQQQSAVDSVISRLPPEAQMLARLNPQAFISNLMKGDEVRTVAPGAALVQGGREVYRNPAAEKDARSSFEKLLDAGGITDPEQRKRLVAQYINKQSTHQAPVNVYSGSLTPGVDAQGQPVFIQPSARPDVQPRVVQGVYPAPRVATDNAQRQAQTNIGEYEAADQILRQMIRSVQSGNPIGMVGLPGRVAQGVEAVRGTVDTSAPSPAIDLQTQKELLLDKMKSLATRKDSNMSNRDAERLDNVLGLDKLMTNPGAAVRAMTNVQNDLRRRRMNLDVRPREVSGPRPGMVQDGYRFKGGDPSKAENWEKM